MRYRLLIGGRQGSARLGPGSTVREKGKNGVKTRLDVRLDATVFPLLLPFARERPLLARVGD